MEQEQMAARYRQALQALPPHLRQRAQGVPLQEQRQAEEIRLRVGQPPTLVLPQGERQLEGSAVTQRDLEQLVELASGASFHAVAEQVRRGYLTMAGGHRIGLCGSAVLREGELAGFRAYSSASIRIARQVPGAALLAGGGALGPGYYDRRCGPAVPGGQAGQHVNFGPSGAGEDHPSAGCDPACITGGGVPASAGSSCG